MVDEPGSPPETGLEDTTQAEPESRATMAPITRQALEMFNRGMTQWFLDASRQDAVVLVNRQLDKIVFEWACRDLPRSGGAKTIFREASIAIAAWEAAVRPDELPDA